MGFIKASKLARLFAADPARCVEDLRESLERGRTNQPGGLRPEDFSIRDLAEAFVVDRNGNPCGIEFVRALDPRRQGDPDALALYEAVDSSAFKNISQQVIYTGIMESYNKPTFVGDRLVTNRPTRYNGEKLRGITNIGDDAQVVLEGQDYPRAGVSEDWAETPQTTKRGLIVEVTKEAVFFDETGQLLQKCSDVGYAIGLGKEKRIIDMVVGVTNNYKWKGTAYDTYQTSTPWVNVNASNGLENWTDIDDALALYAGLTDPSTGEPIDIVPNQLLCTRSVSVTARYILNATQVKVDPNANAGTAQYQLYVPNNVMVPGQYEVITTPLIDARYTAGSVTSTTWFFGEFKRAFSYMENWPLTVVQMPANSYVEWSKDIVAGWKASERGVVAVTNPRYTMKNTA